MKILFVCKGKANGQISSITGNQGTSLIQAGAQVSYFLVKGSGVSAIFSNIRALRKTCRQGDFDVIHAHYAFWGYLAALAGCKPLVVSLMGSDLVYARWYKYAVRLFNAFYWKKLIVKTQQMHDYAKTKDTMVVPNGIDIGVFRPMNRAIALEKTGWHPDRKHVLFAADPQRPEKNFNLCKTAFDLVNKPDYELHTLGQIDHDLMPYLYNAATVVVLSSLREGSVNVVKEAMACNRPVVATDVGDVRQNMNSVYGCFIASFEPKDMADKIELAMQVKTAESRKAIAHLASEKVAEKLIGIYKSVKGGK